MRTLSVLFLAALVAGCASTHAGQADFSGERDIAAALTASADAWNRGDLDGHVAMYADSAAFMTGTGPVVGRARTAETLRAAFFQGERPLQQLRFERVAVRPLGAGHALATGRFILSGGGRPDASGWFSTVWERSTAGWRIIHDHSS